MLDSDGLTRRPRTRRGFSISYVLKNLQSCELRENGRHLVIQGQLSSIDKDHGSYSSNSLRHREEPETRRKISDALTGRAPCTTAPQGLPPVCDHGHHEGKVPPSDRALDYFVQLVHDDHLLLDARTPASCTLGATTERRSRKPLMASCDCPGFPRIGRVSWSRQARDVIEADQRSEPRSRRWSDGQWQCAMTRSTKRPTRVLPIG